MTTSSNMDTSSTKYYRISYGIVEDDEEDLTPDWMCQIMYEVLEVVAPITSSRTYKVYKVPVFDMDAYNVFSLIKCTDESTDQQIISELHAQLEHALNQSGLYTLLGCEAITEITCKEFDDLSKEQHEQQAT